MYVMYVTSTAISFQVTALVGGSNPPLVSAPNSVMADRMEHGSCSLLQYVFMGSNPVGAINGALP